MKFPSLREIFDDKFIDADTPSTKAARENFGKALDNAKDKYNMEFSDVDSLDTADTARCTEEQYMGFLQGFGWAVQFLTGKAPDFEAAEQE